MALTGTQRAGGGEDSPCPLAAKNEKASYSVGTWGGLGRFGKSKPLEEAGLPGPR